LSTSPTTPPRRELERAVDEALYLGLDLTSVRPFPGRRGSGVLAEVVRIHSEATTRTRSDFEELVLAVCDDHGFPRPLVNQVICGYEVDFVWPEARLERDRVRDAALQVAGWRVIRLTWQRLNDDPVAVAQQLGRLLQGVAPS
jgi:hypothetical protein